MVPALESWMSDKVQTAAAAVYGQPVVEMHTLGSYSCRRMRASDRPGLGVEPLHEVLGEPLVAIG